jgi:hypothetical protein
MSVVLWTLGRSWHQLGRARGGHEQFCRAACRKAKHMFFRSSKVTFLSRFSLGVLVCLGLVVV